MKLETKRLILRKPRLSDWKDIVEGVGNFNVAKMTLRIPHPYKKSQATKWINDSIKKWKKKNRYAFILELKKERKTIGVMDLFDIDFYSGIAETGSWINEKYQRKGYITEAKIAVNEFAFNKLKLRKLNSNVFLENKASNKVQKNMGYKLEGERKKHYKTLSTKKIKNVNIYGLLKEDWKKKLPKLKKRLNKKLK